MAENFLNRFTQKLRESYRYVKVNVRDLLLKQKEYHQKTVLVEGKVTQVVNTDLIEEVVTDTWIFDLPQTIPIAKSATYFYLEDEHGDTILIKYPSDIDLRKNDEVAVIGTFNAHNIEIEYKIFFIKTKKKITTTFKEPFISALYIENKTANRIEHLQQ